MPDDPHHVLATLSHSGAPTTALARLQRHLGEEEVARETFRSAAIRLGERAAALVATEGLPSAAPACLRVAEAWVESGEIESARRAIVDVVPHAGALPPDERARLGFLLARVGDTEGARAVLAQLPADAATRALAAVTERSGAPARAKELEEALRARAPAEPWADSAWWDVLRWMAARAG